MKTALIIGGTSGLGLEFAKQLKEYSVIITGRKDLKSRIKFIKLDLSRGNIPKKIDEALLRIKKVDLLIYCAGFLREAPIEELSDGEIMAMNNVTLNAPELIVSKILKKQGELEGFIAVTSTSSYTPRLKQPTYCASKSGLGMFANSISQGEKVKKTLVISPGGMKTPFWKKNKEIDTKTFLEPKWVAEKTLDCYHKQHFKYMVMKFLRNPPRIEIGESRDN